MSKPTEKRIRPARAQSSSSWVAPAESARNRMSASSTVPRGSCSSAAPATAIWSQAVFAPALPGLSIPANGSADSSRYASSGCKPKPRLNVPAAPSFSECAVTSVASRSITICSGRPPACHVRSRTAARAERSAWVSSGSEAIRSITRKAVEPEATGPNSDAWSRSARRSARQSPPSASITARSRTTRPGSCPERRSRTRARPRESALVSPLRSASSASSPLPACDTRPSPSALTSTVNLRLSRCTLKVILLSLGTGLPQPAESLLSRTKSRPGSGRAEPVKSNETVRVRI